LCEGRRETVLQGGGLPFAFLMRLYAVDIVNLAEKRLKTKLDYSEMSLETIDLLM
jgi:hypothetical protein